MTDAATDRLELADKYGREAICLFREDLTPQDMDGWLKNGREFSNPDDELRTVAERRLSGFLLEYHLDNNPTRDIQIYLVLGRSTVTAPWVLVNEDKHPNTVTCHSRRMSLGHFGVKQGEVVLLDRWREFPFPEPHSTK